MQQNLLLQVQGVQAGVMVHQQLKQVQASVEKVVVRRWAGMLELSLQRLYDSVERRPRSRADRDEL